VIAATYFECQSVSNRLTRFVYAAIAGKDEAGEDQRLRALTGFG